MRTLVVGLMACSLLLSPCAIQDLLAGEIQPKAIDGSEIPGFAELEKNTPPSVPDTQGGDDGTLVLSIMALVFTVAITASLLSWLKRQVN